VIKQGLRVCQMTYKCPPNECQIWRTLVKNIKLLRVSLSLVRSSSLLNTVLWYQQNIRINVNYNI